jgi:hypothetical protein
MGMIDSVNTIVEECDFMGLKEANHEFLLSMLTTIYSLNESP